MAVPTSLELRAERETFTQHVQAALGPRVRISLDVEGWPYTPGRYGRIEWRGREASGADRLYVYSRAASITRNRLCAVPGVTKLQIGDDEAVVWMRAEDVPTVQAVAALLRTKTRRGPPAVPFPAGARKPESGRPDRGNLASGGAEPYPDSPPTGVH